MRPHVSAALTNGHLQAVVEANAALLPRAAEGGHPADVLSDGDAGGEKVVEQVVHLGGWEDVYV